MWSKQAGFSLVEMILAIVILGVGIAGVMLAFSTTNRGSADALVQRQMLAIAEGQLEEVLSRPYLPVSGGASTGCARDGFNDLDDYNGYATSGQICTIDGLAVAALNGYSVRVVVVPDALGGVAAKRITVTASRGSDSVQLVGWRTGYAS
jgi:MSHA pilin protein MshD